MASLQPYFLRRKNGRCRTFYRIQFCVDNRRRTLRLGNVSKLYAETVYLHVERMIAARAAQKQVCHETQRWLRSIDKSLKSRIQRCELFPEGDAKSDVRITTENGRFWVVWLTERGKLIEAVSEPLSLEKSIVEVNLLKRLFCGDGEVLALLEAGL